MTPRALKSPTPEAWLALGERFHQSWQLEFEEKRRWDDTDHISAFKKLFTDVGAPLDVEILELIVELLGADLSGGDLKRAWKLTSSDCLAGKNQRKTFELMKTALESIIESRSK